MDTRPAIHLFSTLTTPAERLGPSAAALRGLSARNCGQRIERATRHLVKLGHSRIMLVSAAERAAVFTQADMYGHCQVMLLEGLPLLPRLEVGAVGEAIWPELASLLAEVAPTALLCTQDALVPGLEAAVRCHPDLAHLAISSPGARASGPNAAPQ